MQCREVRELADSFLSEQLLVETNHELLRHLDGCPACRAEMASRETLRSAIQTAFTHCESLGMRDEFTNETIAHLRTRALANGNLRFLWSRGNVAAAAVLLVALGLGVFLLSGRASAAERDAAGDHRDCGLLLHLSEKPISLADAAARYDASYQLLQDAPADEVATPAGMIRVLRRHSCAFDGRRFAHIVLQFQGQVISLLVTGDGNRLSQSLGSLESQPPLEWMPPVNGFNVVSFRTPGHIVFLVSTLQKPALGQVAGSIAGPVYHRLLGE